MTAEAGEIIWYGGSDLPSGWLRCDGSLTSKTVYADLFTAIASAYGSSPNVLTQNQASVETSVADWYAASCTTAQSSTQAFDGTYSIETTATGSGSVVAVGTTDFVTFTIPASAATAYAGSVYVRAASTTRNVTASLNWYKSDGTYISTDSGSSVADSNSAWTRITVTATAPSLTAYVVMQVNVAATSVGEIHYVDAAQLELTSVTAFLIPGFRVPDLRSILALGKAASGTGSTLGGTGGAAAHTHTGPSHSHTVTQPDDHGSHTVTDPSHSLTHSGTAVSDHALLTHAVVTMASHSIGQPGAHTNHIADSASGGHTHDNHTSASTASSGASAFNAPTTHRSAWASGNTETHTHTDNHTHSGQAVSAHSLSGLADHAAQSHSVTQPDTHTALSHSGTALDAHSAHSGAATSAGGTGATGTGDPPTMKLNALIRT